MYYKVSPVVMIILVVVIVLIGAIGVGVFMHKSPASNSNNPISASGVEPQLQLDLSSTEEGQEKVTIAVTATIEDKQGIDSITLPDGTVKYTDSLTYEVTQNGNYTFKATGKNGMSTSVPIEVKNIRKTSSSECYIPEGFSHVEGDVETGFVIEDGYGNQFVWVPVVSGKLSRSTMMDTKYEETNSTASALVNSVAQNYGFYMARYEASCYEANGRKVASSRNDKTPWTNVTYSEALRAVTEASSAFGYEDCQVALVNSYAWDTALNWIDQSAEGYATSLSYGNYSGELRNTGATQTDCKNNICDLAGNVREWTTELFKNTTNKTQSNTTNNANVTTVPENVNYRVLRGGSANRLEKTAGSRMAYKESESEAYWGFRMILYK